jgi:hypothetical protein
MRLGTCEDAKYTVPHDDLTAAEAAERSDAGELAAWLRVREA